MAQAQPPRKDLFLVWNAFQRRAESLAEIFDLEIRYYHYKWEERNRACKALSYIAKAIATLKDLSYFRPRVVFIQLAPTPLLYVVTLYCAFTGSKYISDCHNTMIYDGPFIKWPFAKSLLRRSLVVLVHNDDVKVHTDSLLIPAKVLRDPLPSLTAPKNIKQISGLNIKETDYVIVPCGMASDEPIEELFGAARLIPDITIVLTGFKERLPNRIHQLAPNNIFFTGFLEEREFNALYVHANVALVLTTREGTQPSGASEAISLGVPLVISDIRTTRRLYKDAPLYVSNNASSIAQGLRTALAQRYDMAQRIAGLRTELSEDATTQINSLKEILSNSLD